MRITSEMNDYDVVYMVNPNYSRSPIYSAISNDAPYKSYIGFCNDAIDLTPISTTSCKSQEILLIFNSTPFRSLGMLVDTLMDIRSSHPTYTVILLNDQFTGVDYGIERISICDLSLPDTVGITRFLEHLPIARANNSYWRDVSLKS